MRIFISQPMNGKSDEEILEERNTAIRHIKTMYPDAYIIDSFFQEYTPCNGNTGLLFLSKSLSLMAEADAAYFVDGWESARGCRIEHECCEAYGITCID